MIYTMRSAITAGICLLLFSSPLFAHHGAFYKAVFRAIEMGDVDKIKDLFFESAWQGKEGAMSAAQLQERLKEGKLVPLRKSSESKLYEYSSYGEKISSRCLVTFRLQYGDDKDRAEQIWLLAKRVDFSDRTNIDVKAWQIWRIVTDREQAECFLGRKL